MKPLIVLLTVAALAAIPVAAAETLPAVEIAAGVYVVRGSGGDIAPDNAGRIANTLHPRQLL